MIYGLTNVPSHGVYKLHVVIGHFLSNGLNRIQFGAECFPNWFEPVFKASPGLRDKALSIHRKARRLNKGARESIHRVWKSQNEIQLLCCNPSLAIADWGFKNARLIKELGDFFSFLYDNTLESKSFEKAAGGSLTDHYNAFRARGYCVCPFCGLSNYEDRGSKMRSAYDHWLGRTNYPLAAVNFKNLVPMCDPCNRRPRKGTKNILYRAADPDKRQSFYYPYDKVGGVQIALKCMTIPTLGAPRGEWKVKATAVKIAERRLVRAWDSVFDIEVRFAARVQEGLDGWMKDFLNTKQYASTPSVVKLRRDLKTKATWLSQNEQLKTWVEASLKAAAFSFLAQDAPDAMLAGYAAIATSPAIIGIPTALSNN